MKKLVLSIFAVAALASCFQNEEFVGAGNNTTIEFADAYVGGVTKAIDGSYSNTNMFNKFQVYGTLENNGAVANIFGGVDVMKGGAGWYYDDAFTTYWISGNTYNFKAIVAGNEVGETAVAVDADGMPTTITLSDASAQNDILYAEKLDINYTGNAEPVRFVFEHLLAKAKVSVRNIIPVDNGGYYVVKDVKLTNAIESATYTIDTESWANHAGDYVLEFGHIVAADETNEGANAIKLGLNGKGSSNYERLIVPQANCPLTISINYAYYDRNDKEHLSPVVKEISTEANIEAGKAYNFVLTLAEPGEEIVFDVQDITDWVEGGVTTVAQLKDVFANGGSVMLANDLDLGNEELDIAAGKSVVLNLNGHTIKGVDAGTKSYALIEVLSGASLTINDTLGGKIVASAEQNRGWNAYSSVISNQRGTLTVNGGTIEHLGGTNMAYAIDNLTNGKNTVAVATINGGTIKSTYRAIRQFLNGVEANNELTVNGGVIYSTGGNKAIWMQSASVNANSGKLVVTEDAQLKSDVYVDAENATAIDLDVTVASAALVAPATVVYDLPVGYAMLEENGVWSVATGIVVPGVLLKNDCYYVLSGEGFKNLATQILNDGTKSVVAELTKDIDLAGIDWPAVKVAATLELDGKGHTIKNLSTSAVEDHGFYSTAMFTSTRKATTIKNLVVENATVTGNGQGDSHGAVLVACNYADLTILDVTVKNSTISNCDRTGGLLTYLYFTTATVENCVVEGCTINSIGTAGAILGMNNSHDFTMKGCQVVNTTVSSSEGSNKAGIFIGTWQNAGTLTSEGNTHSGSKAINAGIETNNEIGRLR